MAGACAIMRIGPKPNLITLTAGNTNHLLTKLIYD